MDNYADLLQVIPPLPLFFPLPVPNLCPLEVFRQENALCRFAGGL
jgi:hypothetical protein